MRDWFERAIEASRRIRESGATDEGSRDIAALNAAEIRRLELDFYRRNRATERLNGHLHERDDE